jgi:hypothetical protein
LAKSIFDKEAEPGKYFYCENGRSFKSIKDLETALLTCSSDECVYLFNKHTAGYKNDFSAWIGDVFGMQELAKKIFPVKTPQELSRLLAEYENECNQRIEHPEKIPEIIKNDFAIKKEDTKSNINQKTADLKIDTKSIDTTTVENIDTPQSMEKLKTQISERLDRSDVQFDRVKKIKQHSFYNKADFEDSVEDIKTRYDEVNHSITEHRKEGKDMTIPAMMLRNVLPKINYFQISQNRPDYDKIVELLEDIEKEINYAKEFRPKNLKEEIMEAIGLGKPKKEE